MSPPADANFDTQHWAELDSRFRAPLFAYFLRRVHNRSEAEDLTQEAFLRLARHPDKPQGQGAPAYVFTIAANLLADRGRVLRSRKTNDHQSLGDVLARTDFVPQLVEGRDPERVLVARETLKRVLAGMDDLNERTRQVLILSRLENMQHHEIAAQLGISISAVEKHIMKAIAYLGARFLQP